MPHVFSIPRCWDGVLGGDECLEGLWNCPGQPCGDRGVIKQVLPVGPTYFEGSSVAPMVPPNTLCRFAGGSARLVL